VATDLAEGNTDDGQITLQTDGSLESNVVLVGQKGSGKTTLVQSYINKGKTDDNVKSTTALEYKFTRSSVGMTTDKNVSHFWELGGGQKLENLLDICVSPERVVNKAFIGIVVDLSKPHLVIENVLYWIKTLRQRVTDAVNSVKIRDEAAAEALLLESQTAFGIKHIDITAGVSVFPVKLIIIANKWDKFKDHEPELLKVMSKTLRFIAHSNGAHLLYTSRFDAPTLGVLRTAIIKHVSRAKDTKFLQTDHTKPISIIPAGIDSFDAIGGLPDGSVSTLRGWKALCDKYFQASGEANSESKKGGGDQLDAHDMQLAAEPIVDAMLAQKQDELIIIERKANLDQRMRKNSTEV
jgi:dynein light intermediate chain 2